MEGGGSWERLRAVTVVGDMLGQNPTKNQRAMVDSGVRRKRSGKNDAGETASYSLHFLETIKSWIKKKP